MEKQPKIFVLDTNVLIHNPKALFSFEENRVAIPITVIEEIDNFKKGLDEKGRNARQIGRTLDKLRQQGSLQEGVKTEHGGIIQVVTSCKIEDNAKDVLINDSNDNLIIGTALYLQKQNPDFKVVMVSKDANVRIKADAIGLVAENFETDNIKFDELYTGLAIINADKSLKAKIEIEEMIENQWGHFYPNQFIKLVFDEETDDSVLLRYYEEGNVFRTLTHYNRGRDIFGIHSLNEEQTCAFELLMDDDVKMVTLAGKAGTGKTLLAMAAGLQKVVEDNAYSRLIISRPISPLGKDIGFLPGSKSEKFNPWMQPIYDNMEILIYGHSEHREINNNGKIFGKKKPSLDDYLDFGFIELEPLTYIRGRSLPNQFIIVDEAQNLTPHEMKTIITRAGESTKIVLTGDPYQIDIPYLDSESNGLSMSVEKLKNESLVGHISLHKGERSKLADIAAKYF